MRLHGRRAFPVKAKTLRRGSAGYEFDLFRWIYLGDDHAEKLLGKKTTRFLRSLLSQRAKFVEWLHVDVRTNAANCDR